MPISPFQQPSSRKNALASLIQDAECRGDARQLMVLQSQWVHRYGVSSMPALMLPAELVPACETVASLEPRRDPSLVENPASSEQPTETLRQPLPLSQPQPVISSRPSVPAPPLSTPRSLRRWLPGDDSSILQAS